MKYLITGLVVSMLSATALAGATAPVSVPEPGMLGLFAASVAALYIARNELLRDRYDRWFNNLSLGFINEAVLLASPVLIPLLLLPESPSPYLHPLLAALVAFLVLDLAGYWLHRAYHHFGALRRLHRVHHYSRQQPQTDSNFGEVLTVWDRLFGTYTCPRSSPEPAAFGLDEFSEARDQRLGALLVLPLRSFGK